MDLYDFLERSYKKKLLSTMDSICKDTAVISKAERELSNLTSLKDDEIDGKRFKKIPFDKISLDNYKRVFVIDGTAEIVFFITTKNKESTTSWSCSVISIQ